MEVGGYSCSEGVGLLGRGLGRLLRSQEWNFFMSATVEGVSRCKLTILPSGCSFLPPLEGRSLSLSWRRWQSVLPPACSPLPVRKFLLSTFIYNYCGQSHTPTNSD